MNSAATAERVSTRADVPLIYFDHAATSWPKPPQVAAQMMTFMATAAGNPGRAGHRLSVEAARVVYRTREAVARLFNMPDPLRVVFAANVTDALNLVLLGFLRPGDHVITSSVEHNSVMRPLRALERQGVALTVVQCSPTGCLEPAHVRQALKRNTAMIVLTHASNVCGALLPIGEVGRIARESGALLLVDAAQTAGAYPIDLEADPVDLLAFTGHKSMYGPMGTGGLVIGERVNLDRLKPLKLGGTGSRSQYEEQPSFLPDRYESGTLNGVGLAGLGAGVEWVLQQGVANIRARESSLTQRLLDGLARIHGVRVYGPRSAEWQMPTVSVTVPGLEVDAIGHQLDDEYGILCRAGLHCAPAAHRTLGTFPAGTVRFGLGATNTAVEVDSALEAVSCVVGALR